jgi:hypothetical protein
MLSEKFFTPADTEKAEMLQKKFRKFSSRTMIILVPLDLLIAYIASLKSPGMFLPISAVLLVFLGLMYYFVFLKALKSFDKDLNEQVKLVGELDVKSKKVQKNIFIVNFDSEELKSISVTKKTFDLINAGDRISLEVSKYSNTIFRLEKNREDLAGAS